MIDLLAVLATSAVVVSATAYAEIVYVYDLTTLVLCVIVPIVLGSLFMYATKSRIMFYAFLGFIWAALDDRPIFFDSVLTWPEVTRFHPLLPRLLMNIVIHGLTVVFYYLALREATRDNKVGLFRSPEPLILAAISCVAAYAQNIPIAFIQNIVQAGTNPSSWYPFDFVTKLIGVLFLYLALGEAVKLKWRGKPPLRST
jgi:hypothetical protein